jgi:hypothetical protein
VGENCLQVFQHAFRLLRHVSFEKGIRMRVQRDLRSEEKSIRPVPPANTDRLALGPCASRLCLSWCGPSRGWSERIARGVNTPAYSYDPFVCWASLTSDWAVYSHSAKGTTPLPSSSRCATCGVRWRSRLGEAPKLLFLVANACLIVADPYFVR